MSFNKLSRNSRKRNFYIIYFLVCLGVLSFFFFQHYSGIQGDGIFYYSFTASFLWDGDFELRNQYDHPDPTRPGKTVTNGNYFTDKNTGKAFSIFNPGTGLFMVPLVGLGKFIDGIGGDKHPDSFSKYYQHFAGYTSVILASLSILLISLILQRFFAFRIAVLIPVLFLFATNWFFYVVVFSSCAHGTALFLIALLIWSFLLLSEKESVLSAVFFGFCGGLFFCTRNFSILLFGLLCLLYLFCVIKKTGKIIPKKFIPHFMVIIIFFFIGAFPQFLVNSIQHGSPLTSSLQAAVEAERPFGFLDGSSFRALDWRNHYMLYTNLFNSTNGLFYFHPVYLFGLIGVVFIKYGGSLYQRIINFMLVGVYVFWFIDASYFDNWFHRAAGSGFGHRRFIDLLPLFIFGGANLAVFMKRRKIGRFLISFIFSVFLTCSILLFHLFIHDFQLFYKLHDSFFRLYGYLLKSIMAWFFIILFSFVIFFILKQKGQKKVVSLRHPVMISVMIVLFILPALVLKENPEWKRERFKNKKGFFLMYSLNSYVRLPSEYWGFPENRARPLLKTPAEIILPCPLKKEDVLLFKVSYQRSMESNQAFMVFYADGKLLGKKDLKQGKQIYRFEVMEKTVDSRELTVELEGVKEGTPLALFHEGKVIFRESDELPFGHVDIPSGETIVLDSQSMIFAGWALDDRGVKDVLIKRELLSDEVSPEADKKGLITLGRALAGESLRPDVERVYVLYPGIIKAGWEFELDRNLFPYCQDTVYKIHIIVCDKEGHRTEIGGRKVICQH